MKKLKFSKIDELISNIEIGDFVEFLYDNQIYVSSFSLVIKKKKNVIDVFILRDTNKRFVGITYEPSFISPEFWTLWKQ